METAPIQSSLLWRKAHQEVTSVLRMRDLKIDPFIVLYLMRTGLRQKYPTASEEEIVSMMREQACIYRRGRSAKFSRIRER